MVVVVGIVLVSSTKANLSYPPDHCLPATKVTMVWFNQLSAEFLFFSLEVLHFEPIWMPETTIFPVQSDFMLQHSLQPSCHLSKGGEKWCD